LLDRDDDRPYRAHLPDAGDRGADVPRLRGRHCGDAPLRRARVLHRCPVARGRARGTARSPPRLMDFSPVIRNLPYMLQGLQLTFLLALVGMSGSLVGGTVLALLRLSPYRLLRWPAAVYVDAVRMIPLIMVIFWIFFLLPILTGRPVSATSAAMIALVAFNSSYMAEVVRAGLMSVPKGLGEAARSSGLSF